MRLWTLFYNTFDLFCFAVKNGSDKLMSGRKRIRTMSDSSDDEAANQSPTKKELSIRDKEQILVTAKERLPSLDAMFIQDALFRANWDVEIAVQTLIAAKGEHIASPVSSTNGAAPTPSTTSAISPKKLASPPTTATTTCNDSSLPIQRVSKKVGPLVSIQFKKKKKLFDSFRL